MNGNIKNLTSDDIQGNVFRGKKCPQAIYQGNSGRDTHRIQPYRRNGNHNPTMVIRQSEAQRPCKNSATGTFQDSDKGAVPGLIWILLMYGMAIISIIALFAIPEESSHTWLRDMIISKSIAFVAFFITKKAYYKTSKHYA